jgi:hypothetical protein
VLARAWLIAAACSLLGLAVVGASALEERADDDGTASAMELDLTNRGNTIPAGGAAPAARPGSPATTEADAATVPPVSGPTTVGGPGSTVPDGTRPTASGDSGTPGGTAGDAPSSSPGPDGTAPPDTAAPPAGTAGSRCADTVGETSTEGLLDIDLASVELSRTDAGVRIRFVLAGPLSGDAGRVGDAPATNMWQVLMATGADPVYGFSITQQGAAWETNLVDFASPEGDRLSAMDAPVGGTMEALIPAADLPNLPAAFTWWALTNSDRHPPAGAYLGDDCPDATGTVLSAAELPPESARVAFPG